MTGRRQAKTKYIINMFTKIDLCLLCLTNNNSKLKNILSRDSDGVIIDEKLKFFIWKQIKIEPEDSMLFICLPCLEKLNNVYNYKRLCLQNICRLNNFIHKFKSTDEQCGNFQITLIDLKDSNINEVTCDNELNSDSITSENCKVDKPKFVREILTKENNEIDCINISDNTENSKVPAESVVKEEVLEENEIKFEFVGVKVKTEPEDNSDIIDQSELQNDAFLNETDKNEESTHNNSSHHTGDKPFNCDVCDKAFNNQSSLDRHKLIHSGIKPYKCNMCDKAFSQKCHLETHTRRHTGEQPLKCDECDKAFSHQSNLDRHKLTHTGAKPYKCDICNKAFNQTSILVRHVSRNHTRERSHKCDVCDKAFYHQSDLGRHKLIHSGTKPHKCDLCGKAFKWKSNLKEHIRCHTGEKPYKCDVCNEAFKHSYSLEKHKRCHTGENL